MKPSNKFHSFLSKFLYLANEAGVHKEEWKEDLYNKLTFRLCHEPSLEDRKRILLLSKRLVERGYQTWGKKKERKRESGWCDSYVDSLPRTG